MSKSGRELKKLLGKQDLDDSDGGDDDEEEDEDVRVLQSCWSISDFRSVVQFFCLACRHT